jgi:general secretion pathway protein G
MAQNVRALMAHARDHLGRPVRPARRAGERGMTLLEIMIVIAILGLLASVIVVAVMNQFENAKINTAKIQCAELKKTVHQYYALTSEYPNQSQGFKALTNPGGGIKPLLKEVPKDPWNKEYIYVESPRDGNEPFDVFSLGPDGQRGTDDDIRAK